MGFPRHSEVKHSLHKSSYGLLWFGDSLRLAIELCLSKCFECLRIRDGFGSDWLVDGWVGADGIWGNLVI